MHVLMANFEANPNVGLFGYANDKYCLLGHSVPKKTADEVEEVLKVPVHRISMCGTSLIGVFCNGNNNMLLVPEIAFKEELEALDNLDIPYTVIRSKLTALGNNLLCNDRGCLASEEYSAEAKKRIREALGVSLKPGKIADLDTVGACAVLNSNGCITHKDTDQKEIDIIEDILGVECTQGTVNMGSPYISSGLLANSNGFIVGKISGGPEVNNIDEGLGFLSK